MYVALCLTAKAVQAQQVKQERKSKGPKVSLVPDIARRGVAVLAVLLSLASASHAASPAAAMSASETEVAQTTTDNDLVAKPSLDTSPDAQAVAATDSEAPSQADAAATAEQSTVVRTHRQPARAAMARIVRTPSYCTPSLRPAHRRTTQGRILLIGTPSRTVRSGNQA